MFETTVGTRKLDRDNSVDTELTQQFTPIFQALLSRALGGGSPAPAEDDFHRDPLAAPLPTQLSTSPAEPAPTSTLPAGTAPPSTLDAALLAALPLGTPPSVAGTAGAPVAGATGGSAAGAPAAGSAAGSAAPGSVGSPAGSASAAEAERTRLHAVPVPTGGAHRAEPHAPALGRAGRRAARSGAHRAPETEPREPDAERPATSRGGRHRTLRAVVH